MCYQDPRTRDYLGQIFAQERDAATVPHLGQRLTLDLGVLAAVPRCPSEALVGLLGDNHWQVRSAAVHTLATRSDRPLERVRALAASGSLAERVAAVALLERWGDLEWLAEQLQSPLGLTC
jgi:hypothetical protein